MNDELQNNSIAKTVINQLAEHLGLNIEDISSEDSFLSDLHMRPTELSDFLQELGEQGLETNDLDLPSIKTVSDLIEALSSHVYIA